MKGSLDNLHPDLVEVLTELEAHMGFELRVTSGYRSPEHNLEIGGVTGSEHIYSPAEGADVLCKQSITRFKMVKWLLTHYVQRIGIGPAFVHVGIAQDKPQFVMWTYYPTKASV